MVCLFKIMDMFTKVLAGATLLTSAIWFVPNSAIAGNEHEHIQYLASFDDIRMGGDIGKLPMRTFWSADPTYIVSLLPKDVLQKLLPAGTPLYVNRQLNRVEVNRALYEISHQKTLSEFCDDMAVRFHNPKVTGDVFMRSLFEPSFLHSDSQLAYLETSSFRNKFYSAFPQYLSPSIEAALKRQSVDSFNKTVLSVPRFLREPKLLQLLKNDFAHKNAQVQFYQSIPRQFLDQEPGKFQKELAEIRRGIRENWLDGVDVSGSLMEESRLGVNKYDRLKDVFELSAEEKSPLRLHMFERKRAGDFYDEFWKVMQQCEAERCLPEEIRIAHIQSFTPADLQQFKQYQGRVHLVFEANIQSNLSVQDRASLEGLIHNIEQIHQQGFPVVLGSDGAGMLGPSSNFQNTLTKLKEGGISRNSLERLIDDAFTPFRGTTLTRKQLASWQSQKDATLQKFFPRIKHSAPVCQGFRQLIWGMP